MAADVARADGPARAAYRHQVQKCLAVVADAVDDPGLSEQILTNAQPL